MDKAILKERADLLWQALAHCEICPRKCGVNRLKDERGFCRAGLNPEVYSYHPHHGEEPVLSGVRGSGTIFFTHCNARCIYCQNYQISQQGEGEEVSLERLAEMMLGLQSIGTHNLNLVTPTHYAPQILRALVSAREKGFNLPIVYNTSGYESVETLKLLDGIVDIYMPDMRYGNDEAAMEYSAFPNYVEINQAAVKEMHRQVRVLKIKDGVAQRGLIIRHLVLPNGRAGTDKIMQFIAQEISPDTYISLMSQYHPCFKAVGHSVIGRRVTREEYTAAAEAMFRQGLSNGWVQEGLGREDLERFAGWKMKFRRREVNNGCGK